MKTLLFWILFPVMIFAAQLQNTIPVIIKTAESESTVIRSIQAITPEVIDGVYQISNAAELLWFADTTNSGKNGVNKLNAALTADIDLEGVHWIPIVAGNGTPTYEGTFNGNGHTVSNFVLNTGWLYDRFISQGSTPAQAQAEIQNSGFIGSLTGTVKNLVIENITVISSANGGMGSTDPAKMIEKAVSVGSVVGWLNGGTVDNIVVNGNLEAHGTGVALGGIVGNAGGGKILNSVSNVTIRSNTDTSTVYIGGIVGYTKKTTTLKNDVWAGEIIENTGKGKSGGIIGYMYNGSVNIDGVTFNKEGVEGAIGKSCDKCTVTGNLDYGIYKIFSNNKKKICEIDGAYKNPVQKGIFMVNEKVDSVIFNRTFNTTGRNTSTFSIPFNISRDNISGANFYKLDNVVKENNSYKVYLIEETGDIVANKPYIIKPTSEHIIIKGSYTLNQAEPDSSVDGDWKLRSIYKYTTGTDLGDTRTKTYGFVARDTIINGKQWNAGQFVKMGPNAYTYPFRVLLEFTGDEITAMLKAVNYIREDVPDVIDVVFPEEPMSIETGLNAIKTDNPTVLRYNRKTRTMDVIYGNKKFNINGKRLND